MADGKTDRTVGDIGEFALIERLVSDTPASPAIEVGPGDDAAVIGFPDGRVVACVDTGRGTHFRRDWSNVIDVGRRVAAASLSDINAMGASVHLCWSGSWRRATWRVHGSWKPRRA